MSEPDEFDKMGDFSDEQWQEVYELSDIEQAKMRQIDGNKKGDCSGDLKISMVQRKSLCTLPNTVVASIRVSRSIENTSTLEGKDRTEKRRLERLGKCGHVLTTTEQARQDVILLMNQMMYQKDNSFVVDRVIEVDEDKKLESQAFTIRHMTGRVAKKPRISDRKALESAVRTTAIEACNMVKLEKEESKASIKEEGCDELKAVAPEKDVHIVTSSEENKIAIGKEESVNCPSGASIVVTPEKQKIPSIEPLLDTVGSTPQVYLCQEDTKERENTAIVSGSNEKALRKDKSRSSLPENFPVLPPGLKKSTDNETRIKDYFDKIH